MGWGEAAFPQPGSGGFLWVYIFSPLLGGTLAAYALTYGIEPLIKRKDTSCDCH